MKAINAAQGIRDVFAMKQPMVKSKEDTDKLMKHAEIARFAGFIMERFAKFEAKALSKHDMRDILVKEMKAVRAKCNGKEKDYIPKALMETCLKVLWDQ